MMGEVVSRARKMDRKADGYRYARQYRTKSGSRWACYERQDGRARRIGTAKSEPEMMNWICGNLTASYFAKP